MQLMVERLPGSTPLSRLFPAFADLSHAVWLDSAMGPGRLGRYSYITADPYLVLQSKGTRVDLIFKDGRLVSKEGNPFDQLQALLRQSPTVTVPGIPPFQGGALGYFAYELGHHLEDLPRHAVDDFGLPEMYLGFYDWALARDHQNGETWLTALYDKDARTAAKRLGWVKQRLRLAGATPSPPIQTGSGTRLDLRSNFTHEKYVAAVRRVKEYIAAGDTYQVNLSQRFDTPLKAAPWQLFLGLHEVNPAPYAAYLGFDGVQVVSASPEQFLKVEHGSVETRPIKGTRPRGMSPEQDRTLAEELVCSEKDKAENLMIVDLLRNDLGRVCRTGSISVPQLWALESYPTVHHLVSTVVGELPPERDNVELLKACFPGGSVTGAPKIRAIEIIDELEPTQRSVYCGAIGYLGFNGAMNTSIVIRTIVYTRGRAYFQVGGGIVADSDPEAEYLETLDKARGLVMALESL